MGKNLRVVTEFTAQISCVNRVYGSVNIWQLWQRSLCMYNLFVYFLKNNCKTNILWNTYKFTRNNRIKVSENIKSWRMSVCFMYLKWNLNKLFHWNAATVQNNRVMIKNIRILSYFLIMIPKFSLKIFKNKRS